MIVERIGRLVTFLLPSGAERVLKQFFISLLGTARRAGWAFSSPDFDRRWRSTEEPRLLTWGTILEGSSFFREAQKAIDLEHSNRVLEIGPGYGRLLLALFELDMAPQFYVGVDLSEGRVKELDRRFGAENVKFTCGDARDVDLSEFAPLDLLISSATFEHIHPDFACALRHLKPYLTHDASVVFDLVDAGNNLRDTATDDSGVFVRLYSPREMAKTVEAAGFRIVQISRFAMTSTEIGVCDQPLRRAGSVSLQNTKVALVHRFLVVAQNA